MPMLAGALPMLEATDQVDEDKARTPDGGTGSAELRRRFSDMWAQAVVAPNCG